MATIREVKRELRHREWAEEIAECQSSGMKIKEWCRMKGISCNTYYRRLVLFLGGYDLSFRGDVIGRLRSTSAQRLHMLLSVLRMS